MKKIFAITMVVLLCLSMLAALSACGGSAGDKAYTDWTKNGLPKIEQANSDLAAKAAAANGDRDAVINATIEFRATLQSVIDELAAIDTSTMSGAVKTAAAQQLEQLQAQLATLDQSLNGAGVSGGAQDEAPAESGEGAEEAAE